MNPADPWMPFARLNPEKPDMMAVDQQMRRARLHLRLAMRPDSARTALLDMQQVTRSYLTAAELAQISAFKAPQDKDAVEELNFYNQADIQFAHSRQQFYAALLSSRYRSFLEQQYGDQLFQQAQQFRALVQPEVSQELIRERQLIHQYNQLMASFRFTVDGRTVTRQALARHLHNPDRRMRQAVYQAYGTAMAELSEQLDEHFSQLLCCRHQIAEKLGCTRFSDLAWQRLGYSDITRTQITLLHAQIQRYVLPLTREIRHLQRRRLNLEQLAWYDQDSLLPGGLPQLQVPLQKILPVLASIIEQQSETPFPLQKLQKLGYFTVCPAAQDEQAGRQYSAILAETGHSYTIYYGDDSTLDLLPVLQQIGFAFAATIQSIPDNLVEYLLPSSLAQQTFGQAMALLLLPHLEPALGINHDDYVLLQLSQALLAMTQDCLVDAFEEQLYAQPDLTAAERCQLWLDLERSFLPDLDHEQAYFADGRTWQTIDRIWQQPMGQIGRTISRLTALDIWRLAHHNPSGAWRHYVNLCRLGSQKPFLDLLQQVDLASPLDLATIKKVAYALCNDLSL